MKAPLPDQPLEVSLAEQRDGTRLLGQLVARNLGAAVSGLQERDGHLLREVVRRDMEVNERHRQERERGIEILETYHPTGADLHAVFGLLLIASELERMGDHAKSCAQYAMPLIELTSKPQLETILRLAQFVEEQVGDVLDAIVGDDPTRQAEETAAHDDRIDRIYHRLFDDLVQTMRENPEWAYPATSLLLFGHSLERIADRVTNIAEDVVFLETGQLVELG